ncbi:phosphonate ABC transporter ATP-binding protein [Rhodovibrio salinarum]|uniref:Phosphonate ABC transporter ATP-binding protein n=1 Tax=Rhodovibrio salinarum TaxID=1087 RepID=A0A934QKS6_9PROT|nr:phosphonate ABC transporter ATP-binding protein [Rhodovibrio salinarum]MBK1698537.1 phosphonate ABC transporter ATP-binding protein [Rhodovibrio salinarum]
MLDVRNLTKRYANVTAVDDVSLRVDGVGMVGVIGRSGAGKSTLLRCINRLTDATEGSITFDGVEVSRLTGRDKRAWQRDCAMVFQQFNLVPRLDVMTNVLLGRLNTTATPKSLFKLFDADERREALLALDRLGIAETALQRAETLSGGQQQRVAIARALMQRPRMVLADEPIASLDPLNAQIVMQALRSIYDQDGITVVCNLHTLDTARSYCERVIGMADGRVVFDGPVAELTDAKVREIYGADSELDEATTSTAMPGTAMPGTAMPEAEPGRAGAFEREPALGTA